MIKLNAILLMLTTICAHYVESELAEDWAGWVNDPDGVMEWHAGENRMVTGMVSIYDLFTKDRRWKFYRGSVEGVSCDSSPGWTPFLNSYDETISAGCKQNEAISGFYSHHDNKKEDREWKFECCKLTKFALKDQGLSPYLNYYKDDIDFRCKDNEVMTGLYSIHDNRSEDRRWKARCAALVSFPGLSLDSQWTGWMNEWDETLVFHTEGMVTGFSSVHDNKKEDRRWQFSHSYLSGGECVHQEWGDYVNDWDGVMSFTCPDGEALNGVHSIHDNYKEDRRWKFSCCKLSSPFGLLKFVFTDYINNWDEPFQFFCPSLDQVVIGMDSYHDNYHEDRRWKARCAKLTYGL